MSEGNASPPLIVAVIATVTGLILLVAMSIAIIVLLFCYHKRNQRLKLGSNIVGLDESYSTLNRGTKQQIQPQALNTPSEVYDQIQLSPSTGQSEPVSKYESEDTNTFTSRTPDHHHMQESDVTKTNFKSLETGKDNSGDLTYAVVNKQKKKKAKSEESTQGQENIISLDCMSDLECFN